MRTQDRFGDIPVRDAYPESNHQETSGTRTGGQSAK